MTGESFYLDIDGEKWQYMLVTDPEAALYWNPSSYKLKLSDIKIVSKCPPEDRKRLRREILKDIQENDDEYCNDINNRRKIKTN